MSAATRSESISASGGGGGTDSPQRSQEITSSKLPHGKFGLKVDPRGAQVSMPYQGRTLLGDVVGFYKREFPTCSMRLQVRSFNGEAWPFDPSSYDVNVLVRS